MSETLKTVANGRVYVALDTMIFWDLKHENLCNDSYELLCKSKDAYRYMMSPAAFLELINQRESKTHTKLEFERIFNRALDFIDSELPLCPTGQDLLKLSRISKDGDRPEIMDYHRKVFKLMMSAEQPKDSAKKMLNSIRTAHLEMINDFDRLVPEIQSGASLDVNDAVEKCLDWLAKELRVSKERVRCYTNWCAVGGEFWSKRTQEKFKYNPTSKRTINDGIDTTNFIVNVLPAILVTEDKWEKKVNKIPNWGSLVVGKKTFFNHLREGKLLEVPVWCEDNNCWNWNSKPSPLLV